LELHPQQRSKDKSAKERSFKRKDGSKIAIKKFKRDLSGIKI
jgi:hypothetical protein